MVFVIAAGGVAQEKKTNFAVMSLKNGEGVSAGEAEIIADRLRTELFRTGRVNMMERDQMQEILKEQGFQQSGACTDEACMVEIGQLLGVERLISGSIGKLGSMFLVNLRTIDVQTAKILRVVSLDIKGGIEDVVDELPAIAGQLVAEGSGVGAAVVDKKTEKQETAKPEKTESETPAPAPAETKTVVEGGGKRERNANRGGMRLGLNFISRTILHELEMTNDYSTSTFGYSTDTLDANIFSAGMFLNPQIKFMIKAGRFLTVDVGPGLIVGSESIYQGEDIYTGEEYHYVTRYVIPDISTGVNFVWRIFPLKFNAGLTFDFLIPIITKTDEFAQMQADTSTYDTYIPEIGVGFDVASGGRVGAEILAGPHVGFAAELVIRPISFSVDFESEEYNTNYSSYITYTTTETFTFRPVQFGVSVNFYF